MNATFNKCKTLSCRHHGSLATMDACCYISIAIIHKNHATNTEARRFLMNFSDCFFVKVERVMNGDIIMTVTTVVPAEEQACGPLLKALHDFWELHWVLQTDTHCCLCGSL